MFKIVADEAERAKAYAVRSIVFVEEQACPYDLEFDEFDAAAIHIIGETDGEPFAVGRIRFVDGYAKLERIALRQAYRKGGLGHKLIEFMIGVAQQHGYSRYKMHAQAHLVDFYRQHGFEPHGELFQEANIDHYVMQRDDQ